MKYFLLIILSFCLILSSQDSHARKRRARGVPTTEVELMTNVLHCLTTKDSLSYFYLFPPFDTLWNRVMHNPDRSPETTKALEELKEHPQALLRFDPYYNHEIMSRFIHVLEKGEDSGIHWNATVMQRYELQKETPTRDLAGYDKIAPERFKGYLFVRDVLGRLTFCITITEIQKINGYFFGGQVINILEASSIDQYIIKEHEERKYYEWLEKNKSKEMARLDSLKSVDTSKGKKNLLSITNTTEDEKKQVRKQVIDRKYYEGKFDDEIPVKMFIRYLRDVKSGNLQFYEGLYRFGDQKNYVKLNITKDAEGKWMMEDDPPVGILELELSAKTYTGSWTNNENGTGYDVVLKQTDITEHKLEQLDNMLEKGIYGRVDEEITDAPVKTENGDEGKSPRVIRLENKIKRQKERELERAKEKEQEAKAEKAEQEAQKKSAPPPKPKKNLTNDDL
ncbi:MAG: hypothetical protein JWQ38_3059 [Flavipsychrobacter sp.]|nr:hypothetical protein [Flavipsychrobacter sp.]